MSQSIGRLLEFAKRGSFENMAIDQTLLESVDATGQPCLRFYGWSSATLSLGYFQRHDDRSAHIESRLLPCVRRATGGGAIVHDCELTYSLVLPVEPRHSGPRHQIYRDAHAAICSALSDFGVAATPYRFLRTDRDRQLEDRFLCFQRRTDEDLIVSGYKVVGSAQRTRRRAVLQQGSILLRASTAAPQLPGISDLVARTLTMEELAEKLLTHLSKASGIRWQPTPLSDREWARVSEIESDRFSSDRWLHRR